MADQQTEVQDTNGSAPKHAVDSLNHSEEVDTTAKSLKLLSQLREYILSIGGALEEGWRVDVRTRNTGTSAGTLDVYYFSPAGKKFRSRSEIARHLDLIDTAAAKPRTSKQEVDENQQSWGGSLPFDLDCGREVVSLGAINSGNSFHTKKYIWPPGFQCNTTDVGGKVTFISRVIAHEDAPQFRVAAIPAPTDTNESSTAAAEAVEEHIATADHPDQVWQTVSELIALVHQGAENDAPHSDFSCTDANLDSISSTAQDLLKLSTPQPTTSGLFNYGFTSRVVAQLIEDLPGTSDCQNYILVKKRPGGWAAWEKAFKPICNQQQKQYQQLQKQVQKQEGKQQASQQPSSRSSGRQSNSGKSSKPSKQEVDEAADDSAGMDVDDEVEEEDEWEDETTARVEKPDKKQQKVSAEADKPRKRGRPPKSRPTAAEIAASKEQKVAEAAAAKEQKAAATAIRAVLDKLIGKVEKNCQVEEEKALKRKRIEEDKEAKLQLKKQAKMEKQAGKGGKGSGSGLGTSEEGLLEQDSELHAPMTAPPPGLALGQDMNLQMVTSVVQIWQFLQRFQGLLGMKEPLPKLDAFLDAVCRQPTGPAVLADVGLACMKLLVNEVWSSMTDLLHNTWGGTKREYKEAGPTVDATTWTEVARRYLAAVATATHLAQDERQSSALERLDLPHPLDRLEPSDWQFYLVAGLNTQQHVACVALLPQGSSTQAADAIMLVDDAVALAAAEQRLADLRAEGGAAAGTSGNGVEGADSAVALAGEVASCRDALRYLLGLQLGQGTVLERMSMDGPLIAGLVRSPFPLDLRGVAARLDEGVYSAAATHLPSGTLKEAVMSDVGLVFDAWHAAMLRQLVDVPAPLKGYTEAAFLKARAKWESKEWKTKAQLEHPHQVQQEDTSNGDTSDVAPPQEMEERKDDSDDDDVWVQGCRTCWSEEDASRILLCDGCDSEYHCYCIDPPLLEVPDGEWFCPACSASRVTARQHQLKLSATYKLLHPNAVANIRPGLGAVHKLLRVAGVLGESEWQAMSMSQLVEVVEVITEAVQNSRHLRDHLEEVLEEKREGGKEIVALKGSLRKPKDGGKGKDTGKGAAGDAGVEEAGRKVRGKGKGGAKEQKPMDKEEVQKKIRDLEQQLAGLAIREVCLGSDRWGNQYWQVGQFGVDEFACILKEPSVVGAVSQPGGDMLPGEPVDENGAAGATVASRGWEVYSSLEDVKKLLSWLQGGVASEAFIISQLHIFRGVLEARAKEEAAAAAEKAERERQEREQLVKAQAEQGEGEDADMADAEQNQKGASTGSPGAADGTTEPPAATVAVAETGEPPAAGPAGTEVAVQAATSGLAELKEELQHVYSCLDLEELHPFWGSEARQAQWLQLVVEAVNPQQCMAAVILLERMLTLGMLKYNWRLWAFPVYHPDKAHTLAAVWFRLKGLKVLLGMSGKEKTGRAAADRHQGGRRALRRRDAGGGKGKGNIAQGNATEPEEKKKSEGKNEGVNDQGAAEGGEGVENGGQDAYRLCCGGGRRVDGVAVKEQSPGARGGHKTTAKRGASPLQLTMGAGIQHHSVADGGDEPRRTAFAHCSTTNVPPGEPTGRRNSCTHTGECGTMACGTTATAADEGDLQQGADVKQKPRQGAVQSDPPRYGGTQEPAGMKRRRGQSPSSPRTKRHISSAHTKPNVTIPHPKQHVQRAGSSVSAVDQGTCCVPPAAQRAPDVTLMGTQCPKVQRTQHAVVAEHVQGRDAAGTGAGSAMENLNHSSFPAPMSLATMQPMRMDSAQNTSSVNETFLLGCKPIPAHSAHQASVAGSAATKPVSVGSTKGSRADGSNTDDRSGGVNRVVQSGHVPESPGGRARNCKSTCSFDGGGSDSSRSLLGGDNNWEGGPNAWQPASPQCIWDCGEGEEPETGDELKDGGSVRGEGEPMPELKNRADDSTDVPKRQRSVWDVSEEDEANMGAVDGGAEGGYAPAKKKLCIYAMAPAFSIPRQYCPFEAEDPTSPLIKAITIPNPDKKNTAHLVNGQLQLKTSQVARTIWDDDGSEREEDIGSFPDSKLGLMPVVHTHDCRHTLAAVPSMSNDLYQDTTLHYPPATEGGWTGQSGRGGTSTIWDQSDAEE